MGTGEERTSKSLRENSNHLKLEKTFVKILEFCVKLITNRIFIFSKIPYNAYVGLFLLSN